MSDKAANLWYAESSSKRRGQSYERWEIVFAPSIGCLDSLPRSSSALQFAGSVDA